MKYKEDDVVMCTVTKIEGTTVFLKLEDETEGSMTMSEVAAGRIRNLREYVIPNKKVVCKILKVINGHPQLSLRRVTGKEREEAQERFKKEKNFEAVLKTAVPTKYGEILAKIKETQEIWKFYDEAREKPEIVYPFFSKEEAVKIVSALAEKKEQEKEAHKEVVLKSFSEKGIEEIKEAFKEAQGCEIHYLGSSKFSISAKSKEIKDAKATIDEAIKKIDQKAKEKKMFFEVKGE